MPPTQFTQHVKRDLQVNIQQLSMRNMSLIFFSEEKTSLKNTFILAPSYIQGIILLQIRKQILSSCLMFEY